MFMLKSQEVTYLIGVVTHVIELKQLYTNYTAIFQCSRKI